MKYLLVSLMVFVATLYHTTALAQTETFDLITYAAPRDSMGAAFKKEIANDKVTYTTINKKNNSWCQIFILRSIDSKGSIEKDFEGEWQGVIVKLYKPSGAPQMDEEVELEGWKIRSGWASFIFNGSDALAGLITASGHNRCISVVIVTNSQDYLGSFQAFLGSITLKKPEVTSQAPVQKDNKVVSTGFQFNTSNFDDGWTSVVKEDWVETTKGSTRVLIHYTNKQIEDYSADAMTTLKHAWDMLVAPKYSTASNMQFKLLFGYGAGRFGEADMVEKATGKTVHVLLFKKPACCGGSGSFLEFITPNKASLEQQFGVFNNESTTDWEKGLDKMAGYNKFAVAASDLTGKWTSNFFGAQHYVNVYTGNYAGMTSYSSRQDYFFGPGSSYKWELATAGGQVGNLKFDGVKSNGKFAMAGNWQVNFSDIEGKPKTFNVYFSCSKGVRVLWIDGQAYGKVDK